jgi:PAS domain S-box-containing protein
MDALTSLLGKAGYLPHGYCISWNPMLLWSMVGADVLIALSYYSIPAALLLLVKKRSDFPLNWVVVLFSLFILACGTTHVMDVWTIWRPDYGLLALTKIVTAGISVATAVALWPLLPKALAIPSVRALQESVEKYQVEARERMSAERDLLYARGGLELALARLGAGFISTDRDGKVVQMNEAAQSMTGWSFEEARGLPVLRVLRREGVDDQAPGADFFRYLEAQKAPLDVAYNVRVHKKDGRLLPLTVTTTVLKDDHGEQRGLAAIFQDRSESLRSMAETTRLTALVEGSADAIIGTRLDGTVTAWNKGAETLLGHSAQVALGRPYASLVPLHDANVGNNSAVTQVLNGARPEAVERELRSPDGTVRVVSERVSPVEDGQGALVGVSHILRDVTANRRAESLRQLRDQLHAENERMLEASRMKNEFLANMSHELRTPLNAIIGFSRLLGENDVTVPAKQRREFLGFIHSSGQHLLRLINDILDLSKVESGTFEYYPEPVNLGVLAADLVAVVKPLAEARSLTVDVDISPSLTDVEADPARLKQILFNYVSNALKFSRPGERVTVRMRPEGEEAFRIEVEDRGIGISERDVAKLFVEFQQLDSGASKRHQGTGLGLALTRKLVAAQGGTTGVCSELGVGSVFHAVLPRRGREILVQPPAPREAQAQTESRPQLLVVDEDAQQRQLVVRRGVDAGFSVAACDEREAVTQAGARTFDAVAMSVLVRDTVGPQLLRAVRKQGVEHPVTVVVVPTNPPSAFRVHDILPKPFDQTQLEAVLDGLGVRTQHDVRVLVVDDDPKALALMAVVLNQLQVAADFVQSAEAAFDYVRARAPAVIILDLMMPDMDGFELLELLRNSLELRSTPVVVWTGMLLTSKERSMLLRREPLRRVGSVSDAPDLLAVLQEAAVTVAGRKGRRT